MASRKSFLLFLLPAMGFGAVVLILACTSGGGDSNKDTPPEDTGGDTASIGAQVAIPDYMITAEAAGYAVDVESVGVAVDTANKTFALTKKSTPTAGTWSSTLEKLPTKVETSFRPNAYAAAGLVEPVLFTAAALTRTLPAADIKFNLRPLDNGLPYLPEIDSATIPSNILAGDTATFSFDISHDGGSVEYTASVSGGSLSNGGTAASSVSGTHDTSTGPLTLTHVATSTVGSSTVTLTVYDAANPDVTVATTFSFEVTTAQTGAAGVLRGPAITGASFTRTATELTVKIEIVAGDAAVPSSGGYAWTGTGDFSSTEGSASTQTLPFVNGSSGDISVKVTDNTGNQATLTAAIISGDFPFGEPGGGGPYY